MIRGIGILYGAFAAVTTTWVAWAFATPGDSFANGSRMLLPSLAAASVIGGAAGWRLASRLPRVLLLAFVASIGYWTIAPSGWWAHGPPAMNRGPP